MTESVPPREIRFDNWYGRTPATVLHDPEIDGEAVRIYATLALYVFEGSTSSIGMRRIAEIVNRSVATVRRRLGSLERSGHITIHRGRSGQRTIYRLTAGIFGQKQGRETVIAKGPSGQPRYASVNRAEIA